MSPKPTLEQWVDIFPKALLERAEEAFREVVQHYEEPHRYYHTLAHIYYMLEAQRVLFPHATLDLPRAIWLHDEAYDPINGGGGRNEQESAQLAGRQMGILGCTSHSITLVQVAIICTIDHRPTSPLAEQLCDLDLMSLGLPLEKYRANTAKIRLEYAAASDEQWKAGRTAFITDFLGGREFIFIAPHVRSQYEAQARRNMEDELARLG